MFNRELAAKISEEMKLVADDFGAAQLRSGLNCDSGCAKCCFKSDISCAPIELLPMAYHLINEGRAEDVLEKARLHNLNNCFFLEVHDAELGTGKCREYQHRPFICRAFGLLARHGKNQDIEYSLCKPLKKKLVDKSPTHLVNKEIPFIDSWKKQIDSIDPNFLDKEVPIHTAMVAILEKLLLAESFKN